MHSLPVSNLIHLTALYASAHIRRMHGEPPALPSKPQTASYGAWLKINVGLRYALTFSQTPEARRPARARGKDSR